MKTIKCFLIEETGFSVAHLRRYGTGPCPAMPGEQGYHNVHGHELGEFKEIKGTNRVITGYEGLPEIPHSDPRWPKKCGCGYTFQEEDKWQVFTESLYRRADTGELTTTRAAAPGAIWRAWWYKDTPGWCGADGKCYVCRMPGGHEWMIDGHASNCTRREDKVHKCWCRHGEAPNFTVDKNGNTCSAGAGSIVVPGWHGYLRDGCLVEC
jgi:hypothetical protein